MWSGLLVRFPTPDDGSLAASRAVRVESRPPALLPARPGWASRLMDWLAQGGCAAAPPIRDADSAAGVTPLASIRREFIACLDDVATRQAADLAERLGHARSLRELWHLRAEVFSVVSCHATQAEARSRLARLNRHFPARAD